MKDLLAQLVEIGGPCGYEHNVIRYLYELLKDHADECRVNGIGASVSAGNLYRYRYGCGCSAYGR